MAVMLHTMATFLVTALGVVLPLARIDSNQASGERTRLLGQAISILVVGVISTALSLLTCVKMEVDTALPALMDQVDADAGGLLDAMLPALTGQLHGGNDGAKRGIALKRIGRH